MKKTIVKWLLIVAALPSGLASMAAIEYSTYFIVVAIYSSAAAVCYMLEGSHD